MGFRSALEVCGEISVTVRDKNGKVLQGFKDHNIVTNGGIEKLLAYLATGNSSFVTKIAFGNGDDEPKEEDNFINDAYIKEIENATYNGETKKAQFSFVLNIDEDNNHAIRDAGLVCEDGTLFARRKFPLDIEKNENITVEGFWSISIRQKQYEYEDEGNEEDGE